MSKTAMLWLSVAALCGAVFVAFLPLETVAQQSGATPKVVSPGVKSIGSSKQTPGARAPIGSGKPSIDTAPVYPLEKTMQLTILQAFRDCIGRCYRENRACTESDDPCTAAAACQRSGRCIGRCYAEYYRAGGTR